MWIEVSPYTLLDTSKIWRVRRLQAANSKWEIAYYCTGDKEPHKVTCKNEQESKDKLQQFMNLANAPVIGEDPY